MTFILSQSLISRIVICNILVENWNHIVFPSLSILFLYVPTHIIKFFTVAIIKTQGKKKRIFKISSIRKLISPLNVQANKRKNKEPFKSILWSESSKVLLVRPKIILLTLYSIFLQTINSLFRPLKSSRHRTSNFPRKQCNWYGGKDQSHSHFILY